ncbi:MAG: hypothetical protein ACRDTU_02310 [Micromonosporaceae bacterium]
MPTIAYDGGCGLLNTSSSSEPDKGSVTTQESSSGQAKVTVVNDLGTAATPFANGKAVTWSDGQKVVIQDGQSLNVPFASGPVELTLVPRCNGLLTLGSRHEAARVNVQEAPEAPRSNPDQPADKPGSGDGTRGENPDAGDRPDAPRDPVADGAVPPEGDEGSVGPEDGTSPEDSVGAPAEGDADNKADGDNEAAPMVPTNHNRGPGTTTLALIAVVCLLGVGVAALRTIVVARTARVSGF